MKVVIDGITFIPEIKTKDEKKAPLSKMGRERLETLYHFLSCIAVDEECEKCAFPLFPGYICYKCGHDGKGRELS